MDHDAISEAVLRAARPELAPSALRAHRRQSLAAAMFGVPDEPVRLGRFVLLSRVGGGAMGTVHSAYDPQLDRRVALKLLRASEDATHGARQRMLREAQALARLSHPNVVPVHDAGLVDGQVFIVMEYVVGMTLGSWIETTRPSWSERLAVYLEAGRGLAAAHASGVVHRDFKPENAIRGDDGRVRVVDFGLARGVWSSEPGGEAPPEQTRSSTPSLQTLTATGTVVGTPAYMAPEQFAGAKVGPAADQYAFCAALFEALFERRPYSGASFEALRAEVLLGQLDEPALGEVPRWLYQALRRGLARDPEQRFASMDELLAALTSESHRRRRRVAGMVTGLSLALALGACMGSLQGAENDAPEPCSGSASALEQVWGESQRRAVSEAIHASDQAYAHEVGARVETRLDGYAQAWSEMQREACEVHRRAEQSDSVFDKRSVCLERRLSALDSAVHILAHERPGLAKAVELVEQLPAIETCAKVELLAAEVPPPADPKQAEAAEALRRRLITAEAHERAGDLNQAQHLSEQALAAAGALDYPPVEAEAALVVGRVAALAGRPRAARQALSEATDLGLRAGVDRVAVEAIARTLHLEGTSDAPAQTAALAQLPIAEALAERLPEGAFVHALLLNNAGSVALKLGHGDQARDLFERAWEQRRHAPREAFELDSVLFNLALVQTDPSARAELSGRAHARFEAALGPAHPLTLQALIGHSHQLESLDEAVRVRTQACALHTRYHPDLAIVLSDCLLSLGLLAAEQGELESALEALESVARIPQTPEQPDSVKRNIQLARAYAATYRDEHPRALDLFDALEAQLAKPQAPWWIERDLAYARLGRGTALHALGRHTQARTSLQTALTQLDHLTKLSADLDLARAHARAHTALTQLPPE